MNLTIDGTALLPINVVPEKEEIYRRAAADINGYISTMRSKFGNKFSAGQYLSLAALKFAIDKIDMMRSREVTDEDMKALQDIDRQLEAYLNSPDGNE